MIASLSLPENVVIASGVQLVGWAALTVGTSGVGLTLRIRQTGLAGAVVATTGATTVTAANLVETGLQGFDTGATLPNQVYVLTATVASGAAASTVSALQLYATII